MSRPKAHKLLILYMYACMYCSTIIIHKWNFMCVYTCSTYMYLLWHTNSFPVYRSKSKKSDIDVSSLPGLEALSVPGQLSIHVQCH